MTNQTQAALNTREGNLPDALISKKDRLVLRRLAGQVAELAARPIEEAKKDLWYRHNTLEATRPVIFCDPENGWNEIIRPAHLECEGQTAREWEMHLRKEIFWGSQMGDDRVTRSIFDVRHVYTESDWGLHETRIGGQDSGSYTWDAPLKSYDQLDLLRFPEIRVDAAATERLLDLARETFDGLLTVRLHTSWWWTLGMTWTLVNLRGLEQMMVDMFDQPDNLHRLMSFLRDGHLARIDYLERNGLLCLNNDGTYVGSGGFGWTRELPQPDYGGIVRTRDMWGFAESQETVGVSPAMFGEFILPYQIPLLDRFGLNCYGCCEPVDKRWRFVQKIPRLRRVSVSAWASVERMSEMLGDRYIFSWKPTPADLAMDTFDEDRVRGYLRDCFQTARGCRLEVIMKDNHTIRNDPSRVVRWVQIAREEAERL